MNRSFVFTLVLLILFLSNASSFGKSRQLVDEDNNSNSTTKQNLPIGEVKSNVTSSETLIPTSNSTSMSSPPPPLQPESEKNVTTKLNTTEAISPPPVNQTVDGKLHNSTMTSPPPPKEKDPATEKPPPQGKDSDKGSSEVAILETCEGKSKICRTENLLVACTYSMDKENWVILVQNKGEDSLKANVVVPSNNPVRELILSKHQSQWSKRLMVCSETKLEKLVNISIGSDTDKVVLDAGKGECVLHMYSSEENTSSIHLPSFEKLITPINGAYFLIVSVIILGGIGGFCLCRKNRRSGNGVPYRELELSGGTGLENESTVHDVETADWDEGWDDDWENNAVKSPGGAANRISANGLTARAPNRDGWDHDWDD